MMEGYLLCRKAKGNFRNAKLKHDDEISKELKLNVFYFEGEIGKDELDECDGMAFTLDELIMSGLRMAEAVMSKRNVAV